MESPSICDSESIKALNINPDLTKEEQSQVRKIVKKKMPVHLQEYPAVPLYWNMTFS